MAHAARERATISLDSRLDTYQQFVISIRGSWSHNSN